MLIIEGPDCVGKTTLALKLVAQLNELGFPHVYQHMTRLPECWRVDPTTNYERLMNAFVVMDRFHMSEPIYATACGRKPMLDPATYSKIDKRLRAVGAYTFVITSTSQAIAERYEAKREMFDLAVVQNVNLRYVDAANNGSWGGYAMNVDQHLKCPVGFPEVRDVGLRAYTMRLLKLFPYKGARAA